MTKEVTVRNNEGQSVNNFIQTAIDKGASIETLERLLTMREKLKAEQAKEAFDADMAVFQGQCPVIKKTKKVMNKPDKGGGVRYVYAPLDVIVSQTKKYISQNGFSYTITAGIVDNKVTAVVKVTHKLGHSQSSDFTVPIDTESYMNAPQKVAAALTFAKRYAFCNAFGILTGDEDNDANSIKVGTEEDAFTVAVKMIEAAKTDDALDKVATRASKSDKFTGAQKNQLEKKVEARRKALHEGKDE